MQQPNKVRLRKLSVIIVNYNVCYFLEQALLSVRTALARLDAPAEVFVVDNNSADASVAMLRKRFPEVQLILNEQNLGFAKANNQALRQATGEYILLLNPDTLVEADTLAHCCRFMDAHPDAGGLGVQMLDGRGVYLRESKRGLPTPAVSFYKIAGLTRLFPHSEKFARYYLGHLNQNQTQEVEVLAGAFMFLRRSVLAKTGLLDEAFFMYGEDIDLSYRIRQAGYRNYYYSHTRIIHYKGESTRRGSLHYVYVFYQAMSIFYRKHFSGQRAAAYSILIQLAIWLRAGASVVSRVVSNLLPFLDDAALVYAGLYGRVVIVGSASESKRAVKLLKKMGNAAKVIGFASPYPPDSATEHYLGTLAQLPNLIRMHRVKELIFCGKDVSVTQMMACMAATQTPAVQYKMLPDGGDCIIGRNAKYTPGS